MTTSIDAGPKTYKELFSDPSYNPCGAPPGPGHQEIYQRWRSTNNAPSSDELHRDLLTDFDSPVGAVGFFVKDSRSATGVLKVTHGFRTFAGTPGQPSACRGRTFGYVGDVIGGSDVNAFELDPTQLARMTAETRCANTPEGSQHSRGEVARDPNSPAALSD